MKQAEAATKQARAPVISEVLSTELKPASKHGMSRTEMFPSSTNVQDVSGRLCCFILRNRITIC